MKRYLASDGYYKYYASHRIIHGSCLEDYILESIGREELGFKDIYQRVLSSYGNVCTRIVHRRLFRLLRLKKVFRINGENIHNPELKYRLSKTELRKKL